MKDEAKTKTQLINELAATRQRVAELERLETERKHTEAELRESETKYRDLFESAYDVIFFMDREGNILDINRRGEILSGYSRAELCQMNVFQHLIVPEDHARIWQVLENAYQGQESTYEVRWKTIELDFVQNLK